MSRNTNGGRREPAGTDLMATRPGVNAAALEDLRRDIAKLGDGVAAAAERPDTVTREELDAWGLRILESVGKAEPLTAGRLEDWGGKLVSRIEDVLQKQAGPESPPALVAAHAAQLQVAAERIEAALDSEGERIAAINEWLSKEHEVTRAAVAGVAEAAGGIPATVTEFREHVDGGLQTVSDRLLALVLEADRTRLRWWAAVLPWTLLAALGGMALEGRTHLAFRIFGWFGI